MLVIERFSKKGQSKIPVEFYCNSTGNLFGPHHIDIKEEQLPIELHWLYKNMWGDGYHMTCYLYKMTKDYKSEYGLTFSLDWDWFSTEDDGFSKEQAYAKYVMYGLRVDNYLSEYGYDLLTNVWLFDDDEWQIGLELFIPFDDLMKLWIHGNNSTSTLDKLIKDIDRLW